MYLQFLLFIVSFFFCSTIYTQQLYGVIAKNGLVVRDAPSIEGERIAKIPMAHYVWGIKKTNNTLTINDNHKKIEGHWMEVEFNGNSTGYVFDGYLIPVDSTWQGQDIECDPNLLCNSTFSFDDFDLIVYNYQIEEEVTMAGDTILCYEVVFNEIGSKIIEIIPRIKIDSVQVLSTVTESIFEQYDYTIHANMTDEEFEKWNDTKAEWHGQEEFEPLIRKRNYFAIPETPYERQEEFRQQKMGLRDTLVDRSGESWNVATLIYEEKPCLYIINDVVLKVILFKNGVAIEEKVIVVNLSYGC